MATGIMHIRPYVDEDFESVVALWNACGLLRPWNNPGRDIALCCKTASCELFVGLRGGGAGSARVVGTVMTGSDGHRGWLYYLAIDPMEQRKGLARALVQHAEIWLGKQGIRKVELMIRDDNEPVRTFYERIGYQVEPRIVMSRWLKHDE